MLKLLNRDISVPEDGEGRNFRYLHRETAHWSDALEHYTWGERIRLHRKANNLEPITIAVAEDQLCKSLPPGWCTQDPGNAPPSVNTRFGWSDFVAGMQAFARLMSGGLQFVPQAEADRRAAICTSCFFNVGISGCGTCQKMATLIVGDVAKQKTPYDGSLKACAVCKCSLPALVHFPMEALETTLEKQAQYPDFCWQSQGGENWIFP